jgi:hypothetical protein
MRASWTAWVAPGLLAVSLIYSIYLGFRVSDLEDELARAKPRPTAGRVPAEAAGARAEKASGAADRSVADRLESIEDDLADLQENYAKLDEQLAGGQGGGSAEESRILDVVTKAQQRANSRQLEFHSSQWRKTREVVAEDFGAKHGLERWQIDQIKALLAEETDEAVEILARPNLSEDPAATALDWQRKLDETDAEALRILEGAAAQDWIGTRLFERTVLWPWLPSLQPKTPTPPAR